MATDNAAKKSRTAFVTANKYQRDIIVLAFLPSVLIFLSFNIIVFIGNPTISKAIFHTSFFGMEHSVNQFSGIIVLIMCTFFLLSIIGAFVLSHNMVGAFGRIIRELDEIIAGRSQRTISSRPNDTLTQDLLKRINVLVECYVKHGQKTGKTGDTLN